MSNSPRSPSTALLMDLDAFYLEHWRCGKLEAEVYEGEPAWVVMECSCSARLARRIEVEESRDR